MVTGVPNVLYTCTIFHSVIYWRLTSGSTECSLKMHFLSPVPYTLDCDFWGEGPRKLSVSKRLRKTMDIESLLKIKSCTEENDL